MATKIPQLLTAALLTAVGSTPLHSQSVAAAPTAAQITKYDANRNGRLDPAETVALQADEAKARAAVGPAPPGTAASSDGTVQLSPFEVREANNGYYATNTMSGTRLNTKLEDLASSISVVTKAQMQDFAMLDINDIFAYEANTEGTGNYTSFEVDRNGMVTDQIQNNPQGANRIRGVGSANLSLNNFANSGRAPIDPTAIDSVEISRGPNSNIFGLGEGSGTVNLVASTANLSRANSHAELRFDDLGGWRTSLDLNRPLLRGKVAVRVSAVYQHDEYKQKPSGFETRRFNFMLRAQPFKDTSIRASFNSYHGVGTRATSVTPRDAITYWKSVGSPTWDPVASVATVGGVPRQITYDANNNPVGGFPVGLAGQNFTQPILFLDNGIKLWQISRLPSATALDGPNNQGGALRLLESIAEPVRTGRPLFSTLAGVSSRDVYDYSRINLAAPNSIKDQVETTTVEFEQFALNTERHKLAFQVAWQREDADRVNRNIIGQASAGNASYYLYIDPNTRLLDGRPNPYFGRPYIGAGEPVTQEQPMTRDSYRGQGVYIADFTSSKTWTRWLGRQQFLGYYEERKTKEFRYRFRDVMTSDNPIYAPAGRPKGNQSSSGIAPNPVFGVAPLATRGYYHYYTGDNQGGNIDYAPTGYELGNYGFSWFNPATNAWVTDQVTLGRAGITEGTAGTFSVLNLIKTRGGMIQSTLLDDRIVATFGKRSDENRNKAQRPSFLKANGYEFDYAMMDGWGGDWALRSGDTKTSGIVVKPFRGWSFIERSRASGGASGFVSQLLGGLTAYYNKSDSFRPDSPAISILLNELPNPTSEGKDYGFSINLGNKFVLRANKYTTNQVNTRAGQSAIFAQRTLRLDFANFAGNADAISLQRQARNWTTAGNPGFTPAQVESAVATIMGLTAAQLNTFNTNVISETSDVSASGKEFELSYNPNSHWTLRANLTQQFSKDANLSPNVPAWIRQRLPVWETIIDPRSGAKWLDTIYVGDQPNGTAVRGTTTTTAGGFLIGNVINPLALVQATEGKARPQTREWRFNLNTSYRLAGITEQKHLKRMTLGGAVRWESKGAIGYYGVPVNGDIHAAIQLDPDRPIYDSAHAYFDGFATYTTRLFNDKVHARFQLNVRNIQESKAHLQAVGAYPNGVGHTFRIINPRTFIFTTTFDL
jgi:outer membrane receptor for ferric coprogen and ferric-rhodotorulic acid